MKKLLLFINLFAFSLLLQAQTRTALTPAGKVKFKVYKNTFLVGLEKGTDLGGDTSGFEINVPKSFIKLEPTATQSLGLLKFSQEASGKSIKNYFESILKRRNVNYVNKVLIYTDGTLQGITNRINCALKPGESRAVLISALKPYSTDSVVSNKYDPDTYQIYLGRGNKTDAFDIANNLYETGLFQFAEVDYLRFQQRHSPDPLLNSQWSISNPGQLPSATPGADMKVEAAWAYSTGKGIKVAIVDEGVDLGHPDLLANLSPGFDATGKGSAGRAQNNDAHGTACAGIVGAVKNDIGIAGIAYDCKLIPVRIAYDTTDVNGRPAWVYSDAQAVNGLQWAAYTAQADVISCSWGGGSVSTYLSNALKRIMTDGRNGKGSVVLFSTGNSNILGVSYPANVQGVIAVGASTMCDSRKSASRYGNEVNDGVSPDQRGVSCDNEVYWGSNFGAGLSVIAPGVAITTTDISGPPGYGPGDYNLAFNGTSAACPNAAGVAALVLSANPSLSAGQVKNILESTADKVGGYNYSVNPLFPNGSWNKEAGYGRINALKAVRQALNLKLTAQH